MPTAIQELGLVSVWRYVKYQTLLRSGWLRMQTPSGGAHFGDADYGLRSIVAPGNEADLKKSIGADGLQALLAEADEVSNGRVRLFGTTPRALQFGELSTQHWTNFHDQLPDGSDIKPIWEAGRFGWATVLARAYWLTRDERYAETFWQRFGEFTAKHPANQGPHWSSAQEVALRMISWAFCFSLFADSASSGAARKHALANSLAQHAERIPPTLDYALAQNNNHLLSEAAGLYTAGSMLPAHPKARAWRKLGMDLFNVGIRRQIHDDGAYAQHSANYHRLMLQLGLWIATVAQANDERLAEPIAERVSKATGWLARLIDEDSGHVANLGPNDGAYILPLSVLGFSDHRPVLKAAGAAFSGGHLLPSGPWEEMELWLGIRAGKKQPPMTATAPLRLDGKASWAYLRAAQFHERPGHADQLHLDLWWRGHNIAMDAGTYLYNAPAPWDNALASTRVHNTLTINGRNQMERAGRFLWLRRANGRGWAEGDRLIAEHDGYRALGLSHRRKVETHGSTWTVRDEISGNSTPITARLHWLLPDWPWRLDGTTLRLSASNGEIRLRIEAETGATLSVVRAGEVVAGGTASDPVLGWVSRTYGEKQPALALLADLSGQPPLTITTTWELP